MRRLIRYGLFLVAVVLLALIAIGLLDSLRDKSVPNVIAPATTGRLRQVEKVTDGDTLILDGGEHVRLIGVDAPETHHPNRGREPCGAEATEIMRVLADQRFVRLAFDWERYDGYGRALVYVVRDDGMFVNAEIIRLGYAHAYRKFVYQYKEDFLRLEAHAHKKRIGCLPLVAPHMDRE